jgi:6-phosphogluconolactonase (cycloisomerase 2 family)
MGGSRAYIGSFTAAGGRGVLTAAVNHGSGALTVLSATDAVADPSYLALSASGETLYAVSETNDGALAAFHADADGLRPAGEPVAVLAAGPTHLALYAGHVLTANYGSGSVTAVPVGPDGGLGARASVLLHDGSGPHPQRQQTPHAHQVLPDPSGQWAVSVDLGTDSVRVCSLDPAGDLKVHRETALRPGSGPRHLAFHPRGRRAYVLNELAPTVTVCRWNAADGMLQPGPETPLLPAPPEGDAYPSEIVIAPDGRFAWAATRGADVISVLALDAEGDRLTLAATVPCGGHWPRDLALDPAGRHLYAANERSGDVAWFTIDPDTGIPRLDGSVQAPAASCVIFD